MVEKEIVEQGLDSEEGRCRRGMSQGEGSFEEGDTLVKMKEVKEGVMWMPGKRMGQPVQGP